MQRTTLSQGLYLTAEKLGSNFYLGFPEYENEQIHSNKGNNGGRRGI
jgi:hypothetical protein